MLTCASAERNMPNWAAARVMAAVPRKRRRLCLISSDMENPLFFQKCAVAGPALDQVDRDVDVATRIVGVWARLMRRVHQILGGLALQTRKADVETGRENRPKTARHLMPRTQDDFTTSRWRFRARKTRS